MPLANCPRCKKLFNKIRSAVCQTCEPDEEADFEKVRQSLQELPNQTAEQVAELTGVTHECVLRLLDQGRIMNINPSEAVACGRCGAPAISYTKKLCQKCLTDLNMELAAQQSKIALPPRRQVNVETPGSVREAIDDKRKY